MPDAVGIIMDGNRRWAKAHGLLSMDGHKHGFEKLKEVARWAREAGVRELTVYAFSTENWNRSEAEVSYLMQLLEHVLSEGLQELEEDGICIRFIGESERFSPMFRRKMQGVEARTKGNGRSTLIIALSYGGRAEILDAARKLAGKEVTEDSLKEAMWSKGLLDPDLIIRTGGEMRLSNFLTWGSAYSELMFTDTLWPDFEKEELLSMLAEFQKRERRMGK
ncbi:MAG TPA: polyprenyl diphosphate synthase [Candidatus Paceibacterota bacterium]|nr:polyprenyl diphosphate synthase [Candidatus Paceibacterota bacterium]